MMKRGLAAAAILAGLSVPASAQEVDPADVAADPPTVDLREAFGALPANLLLREGAVASFVAIPTMPEGEVVGVADIGRFALAADERLHLRPLRTLIEDVARSDGSHADWNLKAGVRLEDVRYFAGANGIDGDASLWRLGAATDVSGLVEVLRRDHGFTAVSGQNGLLANGAADWYAREIRFTLGDPWHGRLGQASFVGARDVFVAQASTPAMAASLTEAPETALAADPGVAAALAGLDTAVPQARIQQAVVMPGAAGAGDPGEEGLVAPPPAAPTASPAAEPASPQTPAQKPAATTPEASKPATPQAEKAPDSLPPYQAGLLVDADLDGKAVLLISLSYGDCNQAQGAGLFLQQAWKTTMDGRVAADLTARSDAAGDKACALTVMVAPRHAPEGLNPAYTAVVEALVTDRLELFAPLVQADEPPAGGEDAGPAKP